jgi:hypothetical protein
MEMILIETSEFWAKHKEITRQVVKEEIKEEIGKISSNQPQENIIILEDVCKILKKSKQCIYNYMKQQRIIGYKLKEGKLQEINTDENPKKIREPLYFRRSEIYASFVPKEL